MKTLREAYFELSTKLPIEDIKVKQRLDRGYDILLSYGYSVSNLSNGVYTVSKASTSLLEDTSVEYIIDLKEHSCTCPDYPTARAGLCKHMLAVKLKVLMENAS
jgi:SWIM zinc finger